jgi:hypothetical protein
LSLASLSSLVKCNTLAFWEYFCYEEIEDL